MLVVTVAAKGEAEQTAGSAAAAAEEPVPKIGDAEDTKAVASEGVNAGTPSKEVRLSCRSQKVNRTTARGSKGWVRGFCDLTGPKVQQVHTLTVT